MKNKKIITLSALSLLIGCTPQRPQILTNPAIEYTNSIKQDPQFAHLANTKNAAAGLPIPANNVVAHNNSIPNQQDPMAQLRLVSDSGDANFQAYKGSVALTRDYQGPLDLGDPGVQASLWKETRSASDMLRDDRAWQAGDLITIRVNENDIGVRQARTDAKSSMTIGAALENFFGLAELFAANNDGAKAGVDPENLIKGSSIEEFKGQGLTDRRSQLTARLSVMVAEVLPTGILRIEGKKIVTVNDEEQMMILSGLIRQRDIAFNNEVDSSKVANMRIDYYGIGTLGEVQQPGWGTSIVKKLWPF
jgi:flagellar L-ring protein precursor FlgH